MSVRATGNRLACRPSRKALAIGYFRAYGPATTAVADLIRVAGMRWAVEVGFEDAKGVVGLDHYEVRNWTPWHRHITLALLAHAYLAVTRHTATHAEDQKRGASICSR